MAYKSYDAYLSVKPSTNKEYYRQSLQQLVNRDFENAPNFETIQKYNRTYNRFEDIGVRLVQSFEVDNDDRQSSDDLVTIQFKDLDQEDIYVGDLYEFSGYRWLTIETKTIATLAKTCLVKRCNTQLKFTTATPLSATPITIDGLAISKILDTTTNQFVVLPQGEMFVKIPYGDDAKEIKYTSGGGTRFLLGDPIEAWQVVGIDSINNVRYAVDGVTETFGFIELRLKKVAIDNNKDDLINKVAWQNYFGR